LLVPQRWARLAAARVGLVADIVDRIDPGEEVQDLAVHGAHVADLMPVPAGDDKELSGETSMGEPGTPRNCTTPFSGMITMSA
jgi:antitoxin (DNA-binding transcriptional repressor) of toxin-antitoxin stability system